MFLFLLWIRDLIEVDRLSAEIEEAVTRMRPIVIIGFMRDFIVNPQY